jgi:hypothetical protein
MSCTSSTDAHHVKAGFLNRMGILLDDGRNPIDLTGCTITLRAKEGDAEAGVHLIDVEVTDHEDAAAGESIAEIDLTAVSAEILTNGARLAGEIIVLDSTGVLVYDAFFTLQIDPQL